MTRSFQKVLTMLVLTAVAAPLTGCQDEGAPAPAPCDVDADCGARRCLHLHDDAGNEVGGFCDVPEMSTSNGAAAPCTTERDCGGTIVCLHVHDDESGEELGGYCDVNEMIVCSSNTCD